MENRNKEARVRFAPPSEAFSPSDPVNDSGLSDDNDLTTSFLPRNRDDNDIDNSNNNDYANGEGGGGGLASPSQLVAAAARPHSGVRLVMRKIGNVLASITLLTMVLVIPIVTYSQLKDRKFDFAAFESAAVMVFGTVVLSVRLVYLHFTHWYMPQVQKYVIRILWMVPLYSIQSWLSLRFRDLRIYIDALRDLYEAYVISSFVYYLIELLGGQDELVRKLRAKVQQDPQHAQHLSSHGPFLNQILKPWELGIEFALQCKHGVLQYVVVKCVAAILIFLCQSLDVYGEGEFKWTNAYPYMAFFLNLSVMYALYCLVKLFHAVNQDLKHPIDWHPLGKFLCIKGVVFFTWWQGVLIFYLKAHGIIDDVGTWTGEEVANGLIDYCVCIEMVGFAIAHSYTFTYTEYLPATVQEALEEYDVLLQDDEGDEGDDDLNVSRASYRPPDTLSQPMNMRDAFMSSVKPSETIRDIRQLRNGVDQALNQVASPGSISLQDMPGSNEESPSDVV